MRCGSPRLRSDSRPERSSGEKRSTAKRRKNAAHGASRGWQVEIEQAPKGRKNGYYTDSRATERELRHALVVSVCMFPLQALT